MNIVKYKEIATKSWYNNYFKFIKDNVHRVNFEDLSRNPNILRILSILIIENPTNNIIEI